MNGALTVPELMMLLSFLHEPFVVKTNTEGNLSFFMHGLYRGYIDLSTQKIVYAENRPF